MKTFDAMNNQGGIDSYSNYLGDMSIGKMLVFLGHNRDSGLLDNSNFDCGLKSLGGESKDVQVHRFGHWASGWFELILINPDNKDIVKQAEDILNALSDYPVIDEDDYYSRESQATFDNIKIALRDNGYELTDDQASKVYEWFSYNNQSAIESKDDQGGWPDDNEIESACKALGYNKD